jgi:phosphatidylglycerophosphate synthase
VFSERRVNSWFRGRFNTWLGRQLAKTGVTPNQLTLFGLIVCLFAGWVVVVFGVVWGAFAVLFATLFDMADGAVAKATGRSTAYGAYLDTVGDRLAEIIFFVSIFWVVPENSVWLALVTGLLATYTKSAGVEQGFGNFSSGLVLGRPFRIALLVVLMFADQWFPLVLTIWSVTVLNVGVAVLRIREVRRQWDRKSVSLI